MTRSLANRLNNACFSENLLLQLQSWNTGDKQAHVSSCDWAWSRNIIESSRKWYHWLPSFKWEGGGEHGAVIVLLSHQWTGFVFFHQDDGRVRRSSNQDSMLSQSILQALTQQWLSRGGEDQERLKHLKDRFGSLRWPEHGTGSCWRFDGDIYVYDVSSPTQHYREKKCNVHMPTLAHYLKTWVQAGVRQSENQ